MVKHCSSQLARRICSGPICTNMCQMPSSTKTPPGISLRLVQEYPHITSKYLDPRWRLFTDTVFRSKFKVLDCWHITNGSLEGADKYTNSFGWTCPPSSKRKHYQAHWGPFVTGTNPEGGQGRMLLSRSPPTPRELEAFKMQGTIGPKWTWFWKSWLWHGKNFPKQKWLFGLLYRDVRGEMVQQKEPIEGHKSAYKGDVNLNTYLYQHDCHRNDISDENR